MMTLQPFARRRAASAPVRLHAGVTAARTIARRFALDRHIDFWLREVRAEWSLSTLRARVVDVVQETHDVKTFVLAPNALWPGHLAGQFVTVEVEIAGVRVARCYSISSAPGEPDIAVTVKRVPGGRVSSWMHDHLRHGDVVGLGAPAGDFVVAVPTSKLLLLSGGSGVTPVMSILRDLATKGAVDVGDPASRGAARLRRSVDDVVFVHAARSRRDVVFRRELEGLASRHAALRVALFIEDEPEGGRLDARKLRAAVPDLAKRHTMLCGPAGMMDALSPIWMDAGIGHRLKIERFTPVRRLTPSPTETGAPNKMKLRLLRSGRTIMTDSTETLLEQLERAGEQPANGCRMGICDTCVCRKRSGVVEDIVTGLISSEPDEDIRLCVSRARTDLELAL